MKENFGALFLAIFLSACADSGQGNPPSWESGTKRYNADGTNPVVSTNAVFENPAKPMPIPVESQVKAQPGQSQNADQSTGQDQGNEPKEQGSQVTPEPRTGDDANPDSVNPRS